MEDWSLRSPKPNLEYGEWDDSWEWEEKLAIKSKTNEPTNIFLFIKI